LLTRIKRFFLSIFGRHIASDYFARRYPISIKGILYIENRILLLKNERDEWDLPGGKLGNKETPVECLEREFKEETNLNVSIKKIETAEVVKIANSIDVFILMYECFLKDASQKIKISFEHQDYGLFDIEELNQLKINPKLKEVILQTAY